MENKGLIKGNVIMKIILHSLIVVGLVITACSKADDIEDYNKDDGNVKPENVAFSVKLEEEKRFKVGERVNFKLEGNPESIEFFSGAPGHEYEFRNGKKTPSGMELSFFIRFNLAASSWPIENPDFGPLPWDKISLLISKDFDGDYSFAGVNRATWVNVTNRVTFPSILSSTQQAGPINLSDLTELGKPFYFAFKLKDDHPKRPFFLIQAPVWYSLLSSEKQLIGQMKTTSPGVAGQLGDDTINFTQVDEDDNNKADVIYTLSTVSGAQYNDRFTIRRKNVATSLGKQTWLISKKFDGVQEIMSGGSTSIPIKSAGNAPLNNWSQVYSTPGIYQVYFVAIVLDNEGARHPTPKMLTVVVEE